MEENQEENQSPVIPTTNESTESADKPIKKPRPSRAKKVIIETEEIATVEIIEEPTDEVVEIIAVEENILPIEFEDTEKKSKKKKKMKTKKKKKALKADAKEKAKQKAKAKLAKAKKAKKDKAKKAKKAAKIKEKKAKAKKAKNKKKK